MTPYKGILFDLDGTLLDTAADLHHAFNRLRETLNLPPMDEAHFRPFISQGSRAMIRDGLGVPENTDEFNSLRAKLLAFYEEQIATHTRFFPHMDTVLQALDESRTPWGIVTNKLERQTLKLLDALQLRHKPHVVVCGDTLPKPKPHPDPILHALTHLNLKPNECIYLGDAITDAKASQAAGTHTMVALYGYIGPHENPRDWPADTFIQSPLELMAWLSR